MYISFIYVSFCRVLSLLQQERLRLSVQQVVVQRCCETLPLWDSRTVIFSQGQPRIAGFNSGAFCPASIASILQQYAQECAPSLDLSDPATTSDPSSESEVSVEDMSATSTSLLSTSPPHLHALLLLFSSLHLRCLSWSPVPPLSPPWLASVPVGVAWPEQPPLAGPAIFADLGVKKWFWMETRYQRKGNPCLKTSLSWECTYGPWLSQF